MVSTAYFPIAHLNYATDAPQAHKVHNSHACRRQSHLPGGSKQSGEVQWEETNEVRLPTL
jgi:hypothetical protein